MKLPIAFTLLIVLCLSVATAAEKLEPVRLSADGKSFVVGKSNTPFRVWGVNYDHDSSGDNARLLEDYWEAEWETVVSDFKEIKELGANVVRIHLQLAKFMESPDQANQKSLDQLKRLLALAEETGLYLDITGLGCYHKKDVPKWYDEMNESARWAVQARFWREVAKVCRESNAVFCYDLMNEPVVGGDVAEGWLGGELGGKCYVQRLTLEQGKRTAIEVAKAWVDQLTKAIRAEDPNHMITVGVIPWAFVWPTAKPVFYSPEVSGALDFASIHLYPKKGEVDKALTAMKVYDIGKPLVIEETFPLESGIDDMDVFLKKSKATAEGYVSFYWGRTIAEYESGEGKKELKSQLMAGWLKYFKEQAEFMKRP